MKITAAVVPVRSAPFEIGRSTSWRRSPMRCLCGLWPAACATPDLHARDGYFPNLPYPVVCGHEGAGVIEQVGAAVADLAPGDPVVISFPWCGECGPCRVERISYCERARPLKSGRRFEPNDSQRRAGLFLLLSASSFATFAVAPA